MDDDWGYPQFSKPPSAPCLERMPRVQRVCLQLLNLPHCVSKDTLVNVHRTMERSTIFYFSDSQMNYIDIHIYIYVLYMYIIYITLYLGHVQQQTVSFVIPRDFFCSVLPLETCCNTRGNDTSPGGWAHRGEPSSLRLFSEDQSQVIV